MFNSRVIYKLLDLSALLAVFFTPLLFFVEAHDQFELPKLTFLTLLLLPFLTRQILEKSKFPWTPLSYALAFFFLTQLVASLPASSLSWRISLLGDYENFSGLTTLAAYFLWFSGLSRFLNEARIEKFFFFNSLTAVLSSLYAIAQHFQFDFIQWNPESVNTTREFASMGNPNFLSAYLALSLPLFLCFFLKSAPPTPRSDETFTSLFTIMGITAVAWLVVGTPKGCSLLHLNPSSLFLVFCRTIGLSSIALVGVWLGFLKTRLVALLGLIILILGLLSTASRGGFLGAAVGLSFWVLLASPSLLPLLREKFFPFSKPALGFTGAVALAVILFFGFPFLQRLTFSILHLEQSLETSRLHIWRPAFKIIQENPVHGVGLDTFKIAFPYYSGIEFNQIDGMFMSSRQAHNELLQIAATTGLPGLASYLGVLLTFGWMGWRTYRSSGPSTRWLLAAVFASALAYQVQNLFSFGVAGIDFLWFFFLAVVQHFDRKRVTVPVPTTSLTFHYLRIAFLSILVMGILLFPLPRFGADIAYGRGSTVSEMLKKPDPRLEPADLLAYSDYEIKESQKSVDLFPMEVKYRLYLGLAYEQRAKLEPAQSRDWQLKAMECYQKVIAMSPANAYYYNDTGRVFTDLSRSNPQYLPQATGAFANAVKWAPSSPYFILNYAMALRKTNQEAKAMEQIQNSFQLDPVFSSKVLSQMGFEAYRAGAKKEAFEDLEEAVQGNTSSAEAYYCRGILYLSEKEKKKALADFETAKSLNPTPEKNPSIQNLDQFLEQAKN